MFRVENNVPEVYIKYSRDFQLLARLYDLVLQSTRFSIDSMQLVSDTQRCNERMLPLIATKVGFFHELDISANVHRAVLSAFPVIIKHKGSMKALELLCSLFERIDDTRVGIVYNEEHDKNFLTIVFYTYYGHLEVFKDLIEYVRPTGMIVEYIAADVIPAEDSDLGINTHAYIHKATSEHTSSMVQTSAGDPDYDGGTIGFTLVSDLTQSNEVQGDNNA